MINCESLGFYHPLQLSESPSLIYNDETPDPTFLNLNIVSYRYGKRESHTHDFFIITTRYVVSCNILAIVADSCSVTKFKVFFKGGRWQ